MVKRTIIRPGAMPRWQRWTFYFGMGNCCLSGVSYLLGQAFFMASQILGHRSVLTLHGISASIATFILGTLFIGHIRIGWALGRNKITGLGNLVFLVLLIISGWCLYYGTEEMRDETVLMHWCLGFFFALTVGLHVVKSKF